MHPTASSGLVALIFTVSLVVAAALGFGWMRASKTGKRRGFLVVAAWLAVWGALGASGVLARWEKPPPMFLALVATFAAVVLAARSRIGERFAQGLPVAAIIGFQAFRLPLELVMHRAATEGTMPAQMTYTGANFDIVTGATAIVVAALAHRGLAPRWLLVSWGVLSSTLLVTIAGIATVSTPTFALFGPERLNTWVAWFPFAYLPGFLVPAALFGQIVLFRRLRADAPRAVRAVRGATPS